MTNVYALAALLLGLLAACGGKGRPPEAAPAPSKTETKPAAPERSMQMQGQLGSLDPQAFDRSFAALLGDLQRCHAQNLQRIRWLAGDVKIFLRLGEDGAVRQGFFADSTLGDHETEACMMHVLVAARFPPPTGGEGEVHKSLGFDAPGNVRTPLAWSSDEITPSLVVNNAKIRACRGSVAGAFKATAYVVDGSAVKPPAPRAKGAAGRTRKGGKRESPPKDAKLRGRILAVGIAPPSHQGIEAIECLVNALKQMPVPSPGSSVAKVTFSL